MILSVDVPSLLELDAENTLAATLDQCPGLGETEHRQGGELRRGQHCGQPRKSKTEQRPGSGDAARSERQTRGAIPETPPWLGSCARFTAHV